jgi:hypothetical protein
MLDGAVQGADAIRTIIGGVRELYDRQDFSFAGPFGDNGFIEDYTAQVRGTPLGCLHLITFDAQGAARHIAAHYRPLSSLMFFSGLLRERLAGTPYAERFLAASRRRRLCRPAPPLASGSLVGRVVPPGPPRPPAPG